MNWKVSLDKYLTTPPEDAFTSYWERVVMNFTDSFYEENEEWVQELRGQLDEWVGKMFKKGKSPDTCARVIERAYRLYFVF